MNFLERGLWAGSLATGPMSLMMFASQRQLPKSERSPLPPATLSKNMLEGVGVKYKALSPHWREDLTMLNHFAYGASCGVTYAAISSKIAPSQPLLKGSLFGLAVWAASYAGWIPAVGFRAAAPKMPARRNAMMIFSHLIWGLSLGFAENELKTAGKQMLDGQRKAPAAE